MGKEKEIDTKIVSEVKDILYSLGDKYLYNNKIRKNKVIEDLDNFDENLMDKLLSNKVIDRYYVKKIKDSKIFEINKFLDMLEAKDFWNNNYTKYPNKIGLSSGQNYISESNNVVLSFPFKDTVLKANMSKENQNKNINEHFLNEIIAKPEIDEMLEPKIFKNVKKYDNDGEHEQSNFDINDNLIIKGNNLIALYSIRKKYSGKIKLIYLDPPYNTGNDSFIYNDNFSQSAWLTFMKNRLEIAKELLSEDGLIFLNIDRNEFAEIKILMDEIFEKDNFLATITNISTPNGRDYGSFAQTNDFIHVYAKNVEKVKTNKISPKDTKKFNRKDSKGKFYFHPLFNSNSKFNDLNRPNLYFPFYVNPNINEEGTFDISLKKDSQHTEIVYPPKTKKNNNQSVWRWGKDKSTKYLNKEITAEKNKDGKFRIVQKMRLKGQLPRTVWQDTNFSTRSGTNEIVELFNNKNAFSFPKPEHLLKQIIEIGTNENDIVLDFFMGSATTQAVAMKMNRRFVGIEQMDYTNTVSIPRLQKVIKGEKGGISKELNWNGNGSFIYAELMEKNESIINQINDINNYTDMGNLVDKIIKDDNIDLNLNLDIETNWSFIKKMNLDDQKHQLINILDKNQLYYNYENIEDINIKSMLGISDYKFNKSFYGDEKSE